MAGTGHGQVVAPWASQGRQVRWSRNASILSTQGGGVGSRAISYGQATLYLPVIELLKTTAASMPAMIPAHTREVVGK